MISFETWIEVDPNDKLTQSPSQATWTNMIRNEACYLYVAHTTLAEFEHSLEFIVSSIDVNADASWNHLACIWQICENFGRPLYVDVGKNINLFVSEKGNSTTVYYLYLSHKDDVVQDSSVDLDVGTDYYLTIVKVGTVVTVKIYTDRLHTALVDTLMIDLTGEDEESMSFSYVQTTGSHDSAGDGDDQSDGIVTYMSFYSYTGGGGGGELYDPNTGVPIVFEHILEWEEGIQKPLPEKPVYGRDIPTPEAESYQVLSQVINIVIRMNTTEKEALWDLYNEHVWLELWDDLAKIDDVWLEEPRIRWDNSLGCGDRPWLCAITLICRTT